MPFDVIDGMRRAFLIGMPGCQSTVLGHGLTTQGRLIVIGPVAQ